MAMRYEGGVISATAPTITAPVVGEGGSASGFWTLETQLQNSAIWPKPPSPKALYSWGAGNQGQLGHNAVGSLSSPIQVGALTAWSQIAVGTNFSLAIKTDGTMWSWGSNSSGGRLGQNDVIDRSSPVQIGALTTWSQIAVGENFSLAIKTDGALWSWGYNSSGQLGFNTSGYARSSPVQVGALTTWSQVAAGKNHSLAIKTDGTLWSWGAGSSGQLGHNNGSARYSPVQVGALTTWSKIAGGDQFSLAIKTDGTMWSWGYNSSGQLGLDDTYARSSPVQVGALTTWSQVAAGTFSRAIKTNGTMWGWGKNNYGQLGINNVVSRSSPVQVGALTTWYQIAAGNEFNLAIKTDGTLWSWGSAGDGKLGHNNITFRSSPVQVGALTTWSRLPKMPMAVHSLALSNS